MRQKGRLESLGERGHLERAHIHVNWKMINRIGGFGVISFEPGQGQMSGCEHCKTRGISYLVEDVLASEDGVYCVELVYELHTNH